LGCGIGAEAGFHDLIVAHGATGAPQLVFNGPAAARAEWLGVSSTHLSISDERAYAMAVVILER
ncbi:MAG: holo-ACP synthase, partial [Gammaproteobacteria bacterium]|nr:holo-ACP synthase [Gammaproteobacteria bacterium]